MAANNFACTIHGTSTVTVAMNLPGVDRVPFGHSFQAAVQRNGNVYLSQASGGVYAALTGGPYSFAEMKSLWLGLSKYFA